MLSAARSRRALAALAATLSVVPLAACGSSGEDAPATSTAQARGPVAVENCGRTVRAEQPLKRAVTMNQSATEAMLTLGLQDKMVGTAYLDDEILPSLAAAYRQVPVLAKEYPSREKLLASEPDFVYAAYASAFDENEGVGSEKSLEKLGVAAYVTPTACADDELRPARVTFDDVYGELSDVGRLFGAQAQANRAIAGMKADLAAAVGDTPPGDGVTVMWWDSETKAPLVGACCGGPAMLMRAVGATNAFADVSGSWGEVNWEAVAERDPDAIVLVDASWDTAAAKRKAILADPAMRSVEAVRERRFVVVPFSDSTPGVRSVDGVERLADGLRKADGRS